MLDSHRPRAKKVAEDEGLNSRLQLRYADGELERLGVVCIDSQEQTRLFVQNLDRSLDHEMVNQIFGQFGAVEELFLFRDSHEQFKGSVFIRYAQRK